MRVTKPPKFPLKLLKWFCRSNYHADIEGDLLELYGRNLSKHGHRMANRLLIIDVLLLFRPGILKNLKGQNQIYNSGMFNNYFKVTWRNLLRQKLYAFINIVGLAVGITCFILIYLFVEHERSYDRFYDNADNIYHVYEHTPGDTYLGSDLYAVTPAQLAPTLMEGYPEVKYATTLSEGSALLGNDQTESYWEKGLFTDKYFFKVFSSPFFIHGNPNTAFDHPESIVLTISLSRKIFQEKNAVGKTLVYRKRAGARTAWRRSRSSICRSRRRPGSSSSARERVPSAWPRFRGRRSLRTPPSRRTAPSASWSSSDRGSRATV